MIITLNQIANAFREFSENHAFIKDFGYGPTYNIGTTQQMAFPYYWLSLQSATINTQNKTTIPELTILLFSLDQINDQSVRDENGSYSNNEGEIISDTFQYIQDAITWITTDLRNLGIVIVGNPTVLPTYDETQDKVSGWYATITLRLNHVNCIIPYNENYIP